VLKLDYSFGLTPASGGFAGGETNVFLFHFAVLISLVPMGLKAGLLRVYFAFENVYYKIMDALQAARIPVYKLFIKPVESSGIPSFIVAVIILIAAASAFFLTFSQPTTLTVLVKEGNSSVSGALALITYDGITVAYAATDDEGKASFTVPAGKSLRIDVEKDEVYATKTTSIKEDTMVILQLGT
jgi:hypothetical protein